MDNIRVQLNDWLREKQTRTLRFGPKPEKSFDERRKIKPESIGRAPILPNPGLRAYVQGFKHVFGRRERVRNAEIYMTGLCSDLPHKNGETMEAAIPGADQEDIYNFLVRSTWLPEALDRARVERWFSERGYAGQRVNVVLDETSFLKQGQYSVGVTRQYLGCVGKVANGQVAVTLHGIWGNDDLPLTGMLYLPEETWAKDAARRKAAKVPEDLPFRTKPEIGLALVQRLRAWDIGVEMVHADAGYGDIGVMMALANEGYAFCLGVRGNCTVYLPDEPLPPAPEAAPYSGHGRPRKAPAAERPLHTVDEIRQGLDDAAWQRMPYRQGVGGDVLEREFAALRVHPATKDRLADESWLLLERPLDPGSDDLKQYVISGPSTTTLADLARIAHVRARIERNSYENAKDAVGLADYQGRSWPGFHRHMAMAWLALTWMARLRHPINPPDTDPTPSSPSGPPTAPDVKEKTARPVAKQTSPRRAPTAGTSAASVVPPQGHDQTARADAPKPDVFLRLPAIEVPIRCPATGHANVNELPRQAWESIQSAHRRFLEWCRIAIHYELIVMGWTPPAEHLMPHSVSP